MNNSSNKISVAVLGAAGRMGLALREALANHPSLVLSAVIEKGDNLAALEDCRVAVDFTQPAASVAHADAAARLGMALVIGTTGLDAAQEAALHKGAEATAILYAANMSIGINLLAALVEQAAARLGSDYDVEITEMHHRHKTDAPSGTALLLGRAAATGRGADLAAVRADNRTGRRRLGDIGFASLRGGDVAGDHTVIFAGEGERLELGHRASSRAVFAHGALRAAEWLVGRAPGLYSMRDVLGL